MSKIIDIDWNKVGMMLEAHCSGSEIAGKLGIHTETIYKRCKKDLNLDFITFKTQKRESGKTILKMSQFESAVKDKNIAMQIWLGKQLLGQRDKKDIEQKNINPIEVEIIENKSKE